MKGHKIPIDPETYAKLEAIAKAQNKTPDQVASDILLDTANRLEAIEGLHGKDWSAAFDAVMHGKA